MNHMIDRVTSKLFYSAERNKSQPPAARSSAAWSSSHVDVLHDSACTQDLNVNVAFDDEWNVIQRSELQPGAFAVGGISESAAEDNAFDPEDPRADANTPAISAEHIDQHQEETRIRQIAQLTLDERQEAAVAAQATPGSERQGESLGRG